MLFRKNKERQCRYCVYATLKEDETVLCSKRGIRSQDNWCLRYTYDPCKRIPVKEKALDFSKYEEFDFSL